MPCRHRATWKGSGRTHVSSSLAWRSELIASRTPSSSNPHPSVAILHYTAPPVVGGVEAVIAEHVRHLSEAAYPVRLIVGRGGEAVPASTRDLRLIPILDSEHADNMAVAEELDRGVVSDRFTSLCARIQAALMPALDGIDILIVHNVLTMHFNLALTAALHRLLDAGSLPRMIAWTHDASWNDPFQRPHLHPGYPWNLLRLDRKGVTYVVLTRERQVEIARLFRCPQRSLLIIPNGISLRFWWNLSDEGDRLITELGLLDTDLILLQPTRITQLKNLATSLRIARALKDQGRDFRFLVTGPPDPHDPAGETLLAQLHTLRDQLSLQQEAIFLCDLGPDPDRFRIVPFETIRDLYMASDVILLPSTSEGFGIPILEAGIAGRAIFCADIPPFREIGRDLTHRFLLDEDPASVAQRILAWCRHDRGYMLRRRIRQGFTWRAVFRRYIEPLLQAP